MESKGAHEILAINFHQNPLESFGIHEILAIKSHQIQWNPMGPWGFSSLIKYNGILWDP